MSNQISGADALIKSLIAEGVDTVFGYPGGAIIPVFDRLYDYKQELKHILVRHEQGATHAAQGYARVSNKPGVVIVTSGPAATNAITGISDAMMDSTPMVVITGQVGSALLGCDAFQETDVIGITQPVTKWSYQIRDPRAISWAVSRAFHIATTGRPGPVVLDFAKDAQVGMVDWVYEKCKYIRSYNPYPAIQEADLDRVAELINNAERPMIISGHGVMISEAENELVAVAEKCDIPVTNTLLGLSTIPTQHPLYKGMLGMHGNVAPNIKTNECDVLIAIGMRFDDRVTGDLNKYAKQAKVVHIDIDSSEFDKNVATTATIHGDAKEVLAALLPKLKNAKHTQWLKTFDICDKIEQAKVIDVELNPATQELTMGEVVAKISAATENKAVLVTDVGQNQMFASKYFQYTEPKSVITSGGLGTMGFGLPAAIGAKIGAPERTVCFFTGDGGIQMTIQELGVILQYDLDVKIIILNNNFLGMVRQWQELFFHERYSETPMTNPDFNLIAKAYGIANEQVTKREELDAAVKRMVEHKGAYILNVDVINNGLVFPMTPAGAAVDNIMLSATEKYEINK